MGDQQWRRIGDGQVAHAQLTGGVGGIGSRGARQIGDAEQPAGAGQAYRPGKRLPS